MTLPQETVDLIKKGAQDTLARASTDLKYSAGYFDGYSAGAAEWAEKAQALTSFIKKFISRHEAGLLPDRFIYEEGLKILKSYNDGK